MQTTKRRRQHHLPPGRAAAREAAEAIGMTKSAFLAAVLPRDNPTVRAHWEKTLLVECVPSRGGFMFTLDLSRVLAHAGEIRPKPLTVEAARTEMERLRAERQSQKAAGE